MKLRIKEHKLYLKSDRASCSSFMANQFRLFIHSFCRIRVATYNAKRAAQGDRV
ncbi:MAG: transposase [Marinilabiliaceae bacterium]|nr:transposase [Marinilabiliaceae bacterium]